MFYDLNIKRKNLENWESSVQKAVERLIKFGYKGLAITTEIDETVFTKSKKEKEGKKKGSGSSEEKVIPPPPSLIELKSKYPKVDFYNRINIIIGDGSNIRKFLQCRDIKKYDIISVQPENQNVLKTLTGNAEIDIISYHPECKCDLSFNRKLYNQFVNQNMYFELMYSPGIADSTARRNLLSLSHTYKAIGKSKNVIVTSGVQVPFHVRAPHDVINFNLLFGLSEEQSKSAISRNCEKLLLRARKQRKSKATVEMTMVEKSKKVKTELKMDVDA